MTTATADRPSRIRPRLFAYFSFAFMVGGGLAFLVALLASPQTLDDVWPAVRGLRRPLEGVAWLLGFPFLLGLAIWEESGDQSVRLVAIAALAVAYTYIFVPRERTR